MKQCKNCISCCYKYYVNSYDSAPIIYTEKGECYICLLKYYLTHNYNFSILYGYYNEMCQFYCKLDNIDEDFYISLLESVK